MFHLPPKMGAPASAHTIVKYLLAIALAAVLGSSGFAWAPPAAASVPSAGTPSTQLVASVLKPKTSASKKSTEVGVRFVAGADGQVAGLQFYRTSQQKRAYRGSLWAANGDLLGRLTFPKSKKKGWQSARFAAPIAVQAGKTYVASYRASNGRFAVAKGVFTKTAVTASGLVVPKKAGVLKVTKSSRMPKKSKSSNYFVDVVFKPATGSEVSNALNPGASSSTDSSGTGTPAAADGSCAAGLIASGGACFPTPPAAAASGKAWALTFHDEFTGSSLDTSKWTTCPDWNYGACSDATNAGRETYRASQVSVADGNATITAEPLSPAISSTGCYQGSCNYKSGMLTTARPNAGDGSAYRYSFTYGYVESRMKLNAKKGFFSAFWMLPNTPSFSYDTEIDIAEVLGGDPDTIFGTYHYSGRNSHYYLNNGDHNNGACTVKDYTKDYVRLGVDWQADHIAWYIDGTKCGQFNGNTSTIEDGPMHLILQTMVDNQWQRDWNLPSTAGTSDQMKIDYVRVYQQR